MDSTAERGGTARSFEFWRRAAAIYGGYKAAQVQAQLLRLRGRSQEYIREHHWEPHNDKSGKDMYTLCVDLRGFFIKVRLSAHQANHLAHGLGRCIVRH